MCNWFFRSSSNQTLRQLIPDSIIVNDVDEIVDPITIAQSVRVKPTSSEDSTQSSSARNLQTSIENQRDGLTTIPKSSEGLVDQLKENQANLFTDNIDRTKSTLEKEKSSIDKADHDVRSWANPYWSTSTKAADGVNTEKATYLNSSVPSSSKEKENLDRNENSSSLVRNSKSSPTVNSNVSSWENPYWNTKPLQRSLSTIEETQSPPPASISWRNPYWDSDKNKPSLSNTQTDTPWENPYRKDTKSQTLSASKQQYVSLDPSFGRDTHSSKLTSAKSQDSSWANPYWKDKQFKDSTPIIAEEEESNEQPHPKDNRFQTLQCLNKRYSSVDEPDWKSDRSLVSRSMDNEGKSSPNPSAADRRSPNLTSSEQPSKVPNEAIKTTDKEIKSTSPRQQQSSWEHPYWKDWKSQSTTSPTPDVKSWENPYWKEKKQSDLQSSKQRYHTLDPSFGSSIKQHTSWENPYWKEKKSNSPANTKHDDKSWANPYWKEKKTVRPTTTQKDDKAWENPYLKDKKHSDLNASKQQYQSLDPSLGTDVESKLSTSVKSDAPWDNPYWKDRKLSDLNASKQRYHTLDPSYDRNTASELSTSAKKDAPWDNPYWKDKKTTSSSSTTKKDDKPWGNPYWKDNKPTDLSTSKQRYQSLDPSYGRNARSELSSLTKQDSSWDNPYWKDKKTTSSTATTKKEEKPWANPYWKDNKPSDLSSSKQRYQSLDPSFGRNTRSELSSLTKQDSSWDNPYWKDKKPAKKDDKSWENPYWKDRKPSDLIDSKQRYHTVDPSYGRKARSELSSLTKQDSSWDNPYWKGKKTDNTATTKKDAKLWENPYWKDNKPSDLSSSKQRYQSLDPSYGRSTQSELSTSGKKGAPWDNPYWKDKTTTSRTTTTKKEEKPWANPYWKDSKPSDLSSSKQRYQSLDPSFGRNTRSELSSRTKQDSSWDNPYLKDKKPTSTVTAKKDDKSWENPYWKDRKPSDLVASKQRYHTVDPSYGRNTASGSSTSAKQNMPWDNPYWKDKKTESTTSTQKNDKPWDNPYWKEKKPSDLSTSKQRYQSLDPSFDRVARADMPTSAQSNKAWDNPYWKDNKSSSLIASKERYHSADPSLGGETRYGTPTSSKQQTPWLNPYWKDSKPQGSSTSQPRPQSPWKNPYWKDLKPQTSTASPSRPRSPWKNPYWCDQKTDNSTGYGQQNSVKTNGQDESWRNSYSNGDVSSNALSKSLINPSNQNIKRIVRNDYWELDNLSPPYHAVPPIPSFYERIYPLHTPPSSPRPKKSFEQDYFNNTSQSTQPIRSNTNNSTYIDEKDDADMQAFAIDEQGVARYQPLSFSSPNTINKTVTFSTTQPLIHNPLSPMSTNIAAPSHRNYPTSSDSNVLNQLINNISTSPVTNGVSNFSPILLDSFSSSSSYYPLSTVNVTMDELSEIQDALRLLETNPGAIPIIESNQYLSSINDLGNNIPYSSLTTVLSDDQKHRPSSPLLPSSFYTNSQPTPTFSSNSTNLFIPTPVIHI